jgi:FtsP/CotA-like multicopper oxidase with cupredoxin domain
MGFGVVFWSVYALNNVPGDGRFTSPPTGTERTGNVVNIRLNATVSRIDAGSPIAFTRRSWNGQAVGPTIRVKPGDTLRVTLDNQLGLQAVTKAGKRYWDAQPQSHGGNRTGDWAHDRDVYSHPNFTNIHLHGMHLDPTGSADNVYRTVAPQTQAVYEYHIPADHARGTFWHALHLLCRCVATLHRGNVVTGTTRTSTSRARCSWQAAWWAR